MKTVHKLVLKSFLGPLVMTFFIIFFVLMMNFLWRYIDELTGKGLGADVIIELLFYATINLIPLGMPLVMLLAAIMTMGNLGENFELQAMKSSGMSLMRIMKPLIIFVGFAAVGSFFVVNNLVPYSNKKMNSIIIDIRRQKQVLEFQDGLFFNGIDNMSIRVEHQDPVTGRLDNVLIYDNRSAAGNMTTTIAESGFIRLSDDKKFLLVTLYNGDNYQHTRNSKWYTDNVLRHDKFAVQDISIPMEGFDFQRSDNNDMINGSQSKNITELQHDIDSLSRSVAESTAKSYDPLMRDNIFKKDAEIMQNTDSLEINRAAFNDIIILDSIAKQPLRQRNSIWNTARSEALNSRNAFAFDETLTKNTLTQLYKSKNDWHNKLAIPVSVVIFFLIGAPLGAIIRKGGLGTPIVISVFFFVVYYVMSTAGKNAAEEGSWSSFMGMWISTLVLTPVAIYLLIKATNDSSLLDTDWYYGKFKQAEEKIAPYWQPIRKKITSSAVWQKTTSIVKRVGKSKNKRA
ncbi:MAG: LptF/LptG family permease [Alistipes sp.]|nr:LptF/LptG family permease [Alistipes sp.]